MNEIVVSVLGANGAPHDEQKLDSGGFRWPQLLQNTPVRYLRATPSRSAPFHECCGATCKVSTLLAFLLTGVSARSVSDRQRSQDSVSDV